MGAFGRHPLLPAVIVAVAMRHARRDEEKGFVRPSCMRCTVLEQSHSGRVVLAQKGVVYTTTALHGVAS